ncbi:SecDF P1 head subdomain-containing protein [Saccharothrix variisporea]|uniref:Preprotein translocase subunit SecD n=1 Tax=Saccharothrix variisporea TaxID=543527 RepID=A0A495XHV8_9PSEU|nr:precorrin-3B C(17)-methyltransferase [Saccharothrix variisporea]RKT74071.1 preprotein translocase subunit SecD [Saccharothrix variisporea]
MRALAAVLLLLLTGCTPSLVGLTPTPPAPPPGAVLHFRPVLAVSTSTTPTSITGIPRKAEPDTAAVAEARRVRQDPGLTGETVPSFSCPAEDPLAGRDDPALPLVTCGRDGSVYVLGPAELDRSHVEDAEARGEVVEVRFTVPGGVRWADFTGRNVGRRVAVVVNTLVVSAPTVQEAITGGSAQISGPFTEAEAEELAGRVTGG